MRKKSADHWLSLFRENGIWDGDVYGYKELVADPQIAHNETFVEYDYPAEGRVKTPGFPYKFSETPAQVYPGASQVGAQTHKILSEVGFSTSEIVDFIKSGNIAALEQA